MRCRRSWPHGEAQVDRQHVAAVGGTLPVAEVDRAGKQSCSPCHCLHSMGNGVENMPVAHTAIKRCSGREHECLPTLQTEFKVVFELIDFD